MPLLIDDGFPNQVDFGTGALMCEKCEYRPMGSHAAISGSNGIGKSSTVIDPFLAFLSPRRSGQKKADKGRKTPAALMKATGQTVPYIGYWDLLIDNDPSVSPASGDDMLLCGIVLDPSNLGKDPSNPLENGFRFFFKHSSEIYAAEGDARPAYEMLGIDFYERSKADHGLVRPLDYQTIRRKVTEKCNESPSGRVDAIRDGYGSRRFLDAFGAALGIDAGLMYQILLTTATKEGVAGLVNLKDSGFNDLFIFSALDSRFFSGDGIDDLRSNLSKYIENHLDQSKIKAEERSCSLIAAAFARAKEPITALAASEQKSASRRKAASEALGRAGAALARIERAQEERTRAMEEADADIEAAERRRMSRDFHDAERKRAAAQAASDRAKDEAAEAMTEMEAARDAYHGARIAGAEREACRARDARDAANEAIEAKVHGVGNERLRDLAYTLHALNSERRGEAEKNLSAAKARLEAADAAKASARQAKTDAIRACAEAQADAKASEAGLSDAYRECKEAASQAGLAGLCGDEFKTCSRSGAEKEAAAAEAAAAAAGREVEERKRSLADAEERRERALTAKAEAEAARAAAQNRRDEADRETAGFRSALDEAAAMTGAAGRDALEAIDGCRGLADAYRGDERALLAEKIPLAERSSRIRALLTSVEERSIHIQPQAMRAIAAAGIEAEPAEKYLGEMRPESREALLESAPWAACAIVVPSPDVQAAIDACAGEEDEWFSGAVPIVTRDQIREGGLPAAQALAACPNAEYLADPQGYAERLGAELEELASEARALEDEAQAAAARARAVDSFASRWYAGNRSSAADWESYEKAAAQAAEEAEAAEALAREALEGAARAVERRTADAEAALQAAEAAEGRLARAERLCFLCRELEKRSQGAEEARLALSAAEKAEHDAIREDDRAEDELQSARDGKADAERWARDVREELRGIEKPQAGATVQGAFEALKHEHGLLSRNLSNEIAPLRAAAEKAQQDLDQRERDLANVRDGAEKDGFAPGAESGYSPSEDLAALESRYGSAYREAGMAADRADEAERRARDAYEKKEIARTRFVNEYRADPLPLSECEYGDPVADRRAAERARSEASREKARLAADALEVRNAAALLEAVGVKAAETAQLEEDMPAKELAAALREAGEGLAQAEDAAKRSAQAAKDSVASIETAVEAQDGEFSGYRAACRQMHVALDEPSAEKAERIRAAQQQSATGKAVSLRSQLESERNQLESSTISISQLASKMGTFLRTLCNRSNGEFRIAGLDSAKSDPFELQEHYKNWLVAETDAIMRSAAKAPAGGRKEAVEKMVEEAIVSPRPIIEQLLAAAGRPAELVAQFRSSRYGQRNKWLTWEESVGQSGGEKTAAILTAVISLYSATETGEGSSKGWSVLFVDTPFAGLSDNAMCKRLFAAAELSKVQLVVVEDSFPDGVMDNFPYQASLHAGMFGGTRATYAVEDRTNREVMLSYFRDAGVASQPQLFG